MMWLVKARMHDFPFQPNYIAVLPKNGSKPQKLYYFRLRNVRGSEEYPFL